VIVDVTSPGKTQVIPGGFWSLKLRIIFCLATAVSRCVNSWGTSLSISLLLSLVEEIYKQDVVVNI